MPTHRDTADLARMQQAGIKTLLRRSIDLRRLYVHAAVASEPGLRVVLSDHAATLELVIADLQAQLLGIGLKPPVHGSWRGRTRRQLAAWLMHATPRNGVAWIRLLAHHESALLHAFELGIVNAPPDLALTLRRQLPRLQGIHLDMDSLAGTTRY